ncbi:MAG: hypothetical protein EAZ65_04565 [Verrucomicrobia bacterium]|nr:MAG: hypothetical protein EAZ84_00780 [Verrucomicrobiota bacterium]TAE88016.1 MAG: hypothetical protein EAZ82_05815 [Verrucomicrobiota bacterium]TAF26239.1 MAG: hypothetical protein EAZ71_05380 [Verrucomicrobiota bacterium]TAF41794.1 MAG: hypothetical protein EAZ65_04565 [Verrucomicrobiota bacterium]
MLSTSTSDLDPQLRARRRPRSARVAIFSGWVAVCVALGKLGAQDLVTQAGDALSVTPDAIATSYAWTLDGTATGQTARTFEWTPTRWDTGPHWLKAEMTLPGGTKSEQHWRLRVAIPIPAPAISYHVATNGSDDNSGRIDDPFATLEKARDMIRALPRPLPAGGVAVFVRGGTYRRTATFNLTAGDSGTADAPIVYKAYGSESPVFTTARTVPASGFAALDPAMHARLAPGVAASNIKQLDLTSHLFTHDGPFPTRFNQNRLYNPYLTSQDGGLFEVFISGGRAPLSRYPNDNLGDRFATPCLKMDGVTRKTATTLDGQAIGGQFQYKATDEARIARWQTAAAEGGLWIQGFFRVPWEEYGMKVKAIDTTANTITLASGASMSLGLGNKYYGYEGSKTEPYWALNLLDEIDQPGEWAVDFIRKRLYLWPSVALNDSNLEISDFGSPVFKLTNTRHLFLQGLEFRRSLAQGIVISGGEKNTVVDCAFRQLGSYAVDLEDGYSNGVVGCDISDMASGGIYVRGGDGNTSPRTRCDHFVVNNDIEDIAKVCKIYAAGVDAGFGGQAGNGGGGGYKPSVGTRVANNRIAQTHHVGILHGSLEKTIEYNLIDSFCRTNGDMGGIYCFTGLGGDDTIRYNQMTNKAYAWETYFPNHSIGGSGIQVDLYCAGSRMFGNIIETIRSGFSCNVGTGGFFENNVIVNNRKAATSIGGTPAAFRTNVAALGQTTFGGIATGSNKTYSVDPGFIGRSGNDYRLKTSSAVYRDLSLFREIPVEMIGLYRDETRLNSSNRKPVVDNPSGASNISQTSATLRGHLDFPYINRDSTVRVYWGTTDGGTTAANWQNHLNLGFKTRGELEVSVSALAQKTKYYYRFYASNSAGGSWASSTRSFTTAGPSSTKANNATDLSSAASWTNNSVPAGGLAVWDGTVTGDNSVTIGTGISLLGIRFADPGGNVAIAPGSAGALELGSGGLDLSASNKTLLVGAPVVLSGDQTWTTGSSGAAASTQITVGGNISGAAELRVAGTAGRGVALTGTNSFSGGFVLDATGRVLTGNTAATTTASALGTGPLTIHGGVIGSTGAFALNSGIANPQIFVNDDFTLAPAGRMMIAGAWDLGGGTRTVSCTRVVNSGSAIQSGSYTSWGIGTVASMPSVVANGNLRVVRDASLSSNFVSFRIYNSPAFADNAGLTIGPGVIGVLSGALTNTDATKLPDLTIESGAYFGLCEDATAYNATVGSLSGGGQIGNFSRSTSATTATLTLQGGERQDSAEFAGAIVDTNSTLSALATLGKLNLVKSGSTTQTLAGTNSYSGSTVVSGGTLDVTGSITRSSSLSVYSTGRLTGNGSIAAPASFNGVLEPTGNLTFTSGLTLTAMGRLRWSLAANSTNGAPLVTAGSATIQPGAGLEVEMTESAGSVLFTDPFWSSTRVFPLISSGTISGTPALLSVSADSAGNSHESFGSFAVENTGTAINLIWLPFGSADGWRFENFGTTANSGDAADSADPDGDGHSNLVERVAATDPNDPADYPGINWTQTAGLAPRYWSESANWAGNQVPTGQPNRRLDFLTGITTATADLTSNNNLPASFLLNRLVLAGSNPSGTTRFRIEGNPLHLTGNGSVPPRISLESGGADFETTVATPLALDAMTSVTRLGDGDFVFSGPISGAGGLAFEGEAGTCVLTGDNTYSGGTIVPAGTLRVGDDGPTGSIGSGPLDLDGVLRIDRSGHLAIPGLIRGSGSLSVYNPSANDIVTLSGNNSFLGSVTVGGGGLRVTHSNALGSNTKNVFVQSSVTGSLRLDGGVAIPSGVSFQLSNPNGVLVNEGGENRINGAILLTSNSGSARFTSLAGTLTLAGNVSPATTGRTLDLRGAGNGVIAGNLVAGGGGAMLAGLTKEEPGTWTLSGSGNSIGGGITVHAGRIDVTGGATCSGGLTVANGAIFSGNGSFASGSIQGALVPKLSAFSGPISFGASSTLVWRTTGNAWGTSGRIDGGPVAIASGAKVDLLFNAPGGNVNFQHLFWRSPRTWTLLSSPAAGISGNFTLGHVGPDSAGQSAAAFGSFALLQSATAILVVWTPIDGLPSLDDPLVSRVHPPVSPAATVDLNHALRVAASASGGGSMSWSWSRVSGPGQATFVDPTSPDTFVTFSVAGRYVLRATAANPVGSGFLDIAVDAAPPADFSLREGVGSYTHQATIIRADNVDWNSGARDQMIVGKTGAAMRSILSFDLSSVPRTWPVSAVSLDLWTHPAAAGSGTIGNLHLRRLARGFIEGTGDGSSSTHGLDTGANWDFYDLTNRWTSPGGDFDATALATLNGYDATAPGVPRSFGPTASLLNALNTSLAGNSPLNLIVLAPATESDAATNIYTRFASDDYPVESYRPRLNVFFTLNLTPTISPGPAPAPSVGIPVGLVGSVSNATASVWTKRSGPGAVSFANASAPATTATFSLPGTYQVVLSAANANGESGRSLAIHIPSGLDAWRQIHFGTTSDTNAASDFADPDHDGLANLLEFATGRLPETPDGSITALTRSGSTLEFTYRRSHAAVADGVRFLVEWSDTLGNDWSTADVVHAPVAGTDDGTSQSVLATLPSASPSRFVRLRVARP